MRRFIRSLTIAFICGILVVPTIEAQGRGSNRESHRTENSRSGNRGGKGSRGNSQPNRTERRDNNRPGNNRNNRPANNRQERPNNRPDNNRNNRPANNKPGRPDNRPANNRVEHNRRPPQRPVIRDHHNHRPPRLAPPHRSHRPPMRHFHRPVPPPSWRPYRNCPVINGIFGIRFGTTINISLDYLYNRGYVVDGYSNDVVYLRNVNEMSFFWPDAILYYGANGLTGSQFSYSTNYYDRTRYNQIYSTFVSRYGAPINYQVVNNGYIATWFGINNGYVSLEFKPMYSSGGHLRYYTTLSFGL